MLKKIAFVGAAGVLTAALLTQTKWGGYCLNWFDRAERHIESKVPPERELERIRREVGNLNKDIDQAKRDLATEIVEVRLLKSKVDQMKETVSKSRTAVEARGDMMLKASQDKPVNWDGRFVSFVRAKEMLQSDVNSVRSMEKDLKNQETMLAVHDRTRRLAEEHFQALVSQKSELEAMVTELAADIKTARIEQVESKYQDDGTRMAGIKKSLGDLRKRIEIQRETLNLTRKIDPKSIDNRSVDEIMAGLSPKDAVQVGQK